MGGGYYSKELTKGEDMPPQPYVDRWIKVNLKFAHEGSTMLVGYNLLGPVGRPTEAQLITLCTAIYSNIWPSLQATMSSSYQLVMIEATDRYAVSGAYGSYTPPTPQLGSVSGDALPANVALCISLRTGLSGRTAHGRAYAFGFTDAQFIGSAAVSGLVVALANYIQAVISFAGGIGIAVDYCVLSLKDELLRPVNGYAIDTIADSQRRRLPGRGY